MFEHRRSNKYDNQRFEIGHRAPLVPPKLLPDLPPISTDQLSRKIPPLKRVLSRVFPEFGADVVSNYPCVRLSILTNLAVKVFYPRGERLKGTARFRSFIHPPRPHSLGGVSRVFKVKL